MDYENEEKIDLNKIVNSDEFLKHKKEKEMRGDFRKDFGRWNENHKDGSFEC